MTIVLSATMAMPNAAFALEATAVQTPAKVQASASTTSTASAPDTATAHGSAETSATASASSSDVPSVSTSSTVSSALSASSPQELTAQSGEGDSPYGVWVGGVAVTDANKDNVLKGTANDGSVVFTPADTTAGTPATLTLGKGGEVSIAGVAGLYHGAAIMSNHDLIIDIEDSTTLTGASCASGAVAGIYVDDALTLKDTYGNSLTVTAGDSTDGTTIAGEDFSAGIYADEDISISNVECTATGGGGTSLSFGVFARGTLTMTGGYTELAGNGGAGSAVSIGICALGDMKVTSDIQIVAKGADVAGGSSAGLCVQSLSLGDEYDDPTIEAYGGAANSSYGILTDTARSSADTGITLVGRSSITAQGGDATLESYGVRCANATSVVSVSGNSHVEAIAGSASAADGTSEGIVGCLAYNVNADKDVDRADHGPIVDASSGAAKTSKALSAGPQISGDYRWLTDEVSSWQHGTVNPFQYSGSEQSVSLRSASFLVWVGRTQVTMANEDDVLGDEKVSFVPATDGSSLGTLSLNSASINDSSRSSVPAIEAHGSLTINLAGDSTAVGGDGYDYAIGVYTRTSNSYDDTGDALTVTGDGTLHVTSLPSYDNKGAATLKVGEAGKSPLIISGAAKVIAEAPSGTANSHGVEAGDITLTGAASLTGIGGLAWSSSVGIFSFGAISLSDTSTLAGIGGTSTKKSFIATSSGVYISGSVTVADDATLEAHGGAADYGTSRGFQMYYGTFVVTGGTLDIQSGVGKNNQASNIAPDLSGYASYQWKTAEADPWTNSATTQYGYDSAQTYIQVAPVEYDVWVGGVRVNSANKGNVLKGTANDGKVSYDPDTKTLSLSGANLAGADGVNDGAGIYTTLDGLTIDVTGDNTVTGAAGSDTAGMSCGIEAPNLTITGEGSLDVTAADMTAGSGTKSYGVLGNVKLEDGVHVVFAAGKASTSSATSAALDLSSYGAYHWRTSSAGAWTDGTTVPYAFAASDAYVEIAAGTVSVPTAYTASTSSGSQAAALADTGDGSLTLPLVLLVSALVAMGALAACRLRSASE